LTKVLLAAACRLAGSPTARSTEGAPAAMAKKRCDKCDRLYDGFGTTCGGCRRSLGVSGSSQVCAACAAHFWGFGRLCDDCDPCLVEGWLRFWFEGRLVPGYCRLYMTRLDAWADEGEADAQPPVGSLRCGEILSWKPLAQADDDHGAGPRSMRGFVFNFGARRKFAYTADNDEEDFRAWSAALSRLPIQTADAGRGCDNAGAAPGSNQARQLAAGAAVVRAAHAHGSCGAARAAARSAGTHHLKSTVCSRAPHLASPVTDATVNRTPIGEAALDRVAGQLERSEGERGQLAALVGTMRSRLKVAALRVHGVGRKPGMQAQQIEWDRFFRQLDRNHSGHLDWNEFLHVCRTMLDLSHVNASDAQLRAVFRSLDADRSGEVELEELAAFMVDPVRRVRFRIRSAARRAGGGTLAEYFAAQDRDRSGLLDFEEFARMCRDALGLVEEDAHLGIVFHALDPDGSGLISFEEFSAFVLEEAPPELARVGAPAMAVPSGKSSDIGHAMALDAEAWPEASQSLLRRGWLLFEESGGAVTRGYCQLHGDCLKTWRLPSDASNGALPIGLIPLHDVLGWRLEPAGSRGGQFGGCALLFGDVQKRMLFESERDAREWTAAFRSILMPPMLPSRSPKTSGRIFHQNPRTGASPREQNAHLRTTKAQECRQQATGEEAHLWNLKILLRNPAFVEDLERLDHDADRAKQTQEGRAQLVGLVAQMRVLMKEAAWSAKGVDWVMLFQMEDKDHSGAITWDEFRTMCRSKLRLTERRAPDRQLRAVFRSLDADQSGAIEIEELVGFLADPVGRMMQRLIKAARAMPDWEAFVAKQDRDGSGLIEWREFVEMCRRRFNILDDETQLAMVFEALDADGSGSISFGELVSLVSREGEVGRRSLVRRNSAGM